MSREKIFSDIRRGLNRKGALDATITKALVSRLCDPAPERNEAGTNLDEQDSLSAEFIRQLTAAGATVDQVDDGDGALVALQQFRQTHQLHSDVVVNDDAIVQSLPFDASFAVSARPVGDADELSVTGALCAVAETGSVVLRSGSQGATRSGFLPDNHVVIVKRSQLVGATEDVWPLALDETGRLPRSVNLVTGPSKTADVEQTLQHGAHGPCALHVIIVDDG